MYKKILVPLDGSELAECVLPHVESIAKSGLAESVTFLLVVEPFYAPINADEGYSFTPEDWANIEEQAKVLAMNYLNKVTRKLRLEGIDVKPLVLSGKAAEVISDYAANNGTNLIIIAAHGRSGANRWVWGSVAEKVLRTSEVPVLMVRAPCTDSDSIK